MTKQNQRKPTLINQSSKLTLQGYMKLKKGVCLVIRAHAHDLVKPKVILVLICFSMWECMDLQGVCVSKEDIGLRHEGPT